MKPKSTLLSIAIAILMLLLPTTGFAPETVMIEEVRIAAGLEAHTPSTCTESNNFNLIGPRWNSFPVTYKIDVSGAPSDVQAGTPAAIIAGFEAWEGIEPSFPTSSRT